MSGQLIGGKNPIYTPDPYEMKEKAERDHARAMAEKQCVAVVHVNSSSSSSSSNNNNNLFWDG